MMANLKPCDQAPVGNLARFLLLLGLPFGLASLSFAETPDVVQPVTDSEIIAPFINPDCFFAGQFTQVKTIPGLEVELRVAGQFVFDCQVGVIWSTQQPLLESQLFTFDGDNHVINGDDTIVKIEGRYGDAVSKLMLALIGGDSQSLANTFDFSLVETQSPDYTVALTPKRKRLRNVFSAITLTKHSQPNPSGAEVEQVSFYLEDRNGQTLTVSSNLSSTFESQTAIREACPGQFTRQGGKLCDFFYDSSEQ